MSRVEPFLLGLFLACWALGLAYSAGFLSPPGTLALSFYGLFTIAAALGWLAGNIYMARSRGILRPARRTFFLLYFLGPPGLLYLLRLLAPLEQQAIAPLVPLYSFGVFATFFLVPVTLRRTPRE